jgi:hypothetical protein
MSSDATGASYDPFCLLTTYAYDAQLGSLVHQGGSAFDLHGRLVHSADPATHPGHCRLRRQRGRVRRC